MGACQPDSGRLAHSIPRLATVASERDPMHQATTGPEQDFLTRWFVKSKWSTLDVKRLGSDGWCVLSGTSDARCSKQRFY